MINRIYSVVLAMLLCPAGVMLAQEPSPTATPMPQRDEAEPGMRQMQRAQQLAQRTRDVQYRRIERLGPFPAGGALRVGPPGKWWSNPEMAQKLGLTKEQQKKMDDIFQQSRLKLIDANASLQKEEAILDPLVESDQPDESKILAQIDRVAQARAELEKTNARMLLGLRQVLTPDQWEKLRAERPRRMELMRPGGMAMQFQPGAAVRPAPQLPPLE